MDIFNELMAECRKTHYKGWDKDELAECLEKANLLDRREQFLLYNTKWLTKGDPFKRELFCMIHKETLEAKVVPTSIKRRHTRWYAFRKENVEEYTIGNGEIIRYNYFDGYERLKSIVIQYHLWGDDDVAGPFGSFTPNLERFRVVSKKSPFFTVDDVLYLNVEKARKEDDYRILSDIIYHEIGTGFSYLSKTLQCGEYESSVTQSGIMLVSMPPKHRFREFVVPDFVSMIGVNAFDASNIETLVIPDTVKFIGMGAFYRMKNLKVLKVPNKTFPVDLQYSFIGHEIDIRNSETDEELDEKIRAYWHYYLVEFNDLEDSWAEIKEPEYERLFYLPEIIEKYQDSMSQEDYEAYLESTLPNNFPDELPF